MNSSQDEVFRSRIERLRVEMGAMDVDGALLSIGADLPYFTGYEAMPSERLTMLFVPTEGTPSMFVPQLEVPRVGDSFFEVRAWDETDDPLDLVASSCSTSRRLAIGDHTWSAFLVGLLERLPNAEWIPASRVTSRLRLVKDRTELDALRNAARGVDRVLARVPSEVPFAGRSELDVARDLMRMVVEEGHDDAGFAIVGSGPNGASPHHEPGNRVIDEGDVVVCDFGGRVGGYHSDATRTFSVGQPDERALEVHAVVRAANEEGRHAVAPGVPCQEIDRAARKVIADAGFDEFFIHRTGHGIGLEVHEHPYIVEGNEEKLVPGMTFSVEPGIYIPGQFGVRIEDIVACADNGADSLNRADRGLIVVS